VVGVMEGSLWVQGAGQKERRVCWVHTRRLLFGVLGYLLAGAGLLFACGSDAGDHVRQIPDHADNVLQRCVRPAGISLRKQDVTRNDADPLIVL
jgi:hypothetical protein